MGIRPLTALLPFLDEQEVDSATHSLQGCSTGNATDCDRLLAAILESEITVPPRSRLLSFAVLGSHTEVDSATHCAVLDPS